MEGMTPRDEGAMREQARAIRGTLEGLGQELRAVDAVLGPRRAQHQLLGEACTALQRLEELDAADLFWGEHARPGQAAEHLRGLRSRIAALDGEVAGLESQRQALRERIAAQEEALCVLGEDLYQLQEQEERRKLEWVVERDISPVPGRAQVIAWARGGEDDRRLRKSLAAALAASLLAGAIVPLIDLPEPRRFVPEDVPERLAELVRKEQERVLPPPVEPRPVPDQAKPQETRPREQQPAEPRPLDPAYAEARPQQPESTPEPAGILAFRDQFAGLARDKAAPRLGTAARFDDAEESSSAPTTRSMLTSSAPGSSGGINLASISRNVGGGGNGTGSGGGGAGGLHGVQVGRATSSIASIGGGGADRPRAGSGPGLSRTDEEIQIVFDRYKASFYRLYNRELRKDPTLQGQMVLRLTIEPDGSVSMCELFASDMEAPELSAQVVDRVRGINFGAKEGVVALTIVYPIDFLPAA
jgi:hypothetical protein